jgi:serine/threonine-protein kinase
VSPWLDAGALVSGRYEVQQPLGCGGMGVVYRAHDRVLDDTIALKVLAGGPPEAELEQRLRRETKLARRVTHENVCRIHEYGEDHGLRYVSMELVDGEDLKQRIRRAALPDAEVFSVSLQALAGLEAIHRAGIIHRDVKTANLMVDRRGVVKVMDFGIARPADGTGPGGLTQTGVIVGSPEYMSPEQARGEPLDARSDVYSMGIVLFELFAGRVPFHGDSPLATVLQHLHTPPPLDGAAAARLPRAMLPVLRSALAKRPEERHDSAARLAEAVRQARDAGESQSSARTWTIATPTPAVSERPTVPGPAPEVPDRGSGGPGDAGPRRPSRLRAMYAGSAVLLLAIGFWQWSRTWRPREPAAAGAPTTVAPRSPSPSPSTSPPVVARRAPPRGVPIAGAGPLRPGPAATPSSDSEPPAEEPLEPAAVPIGTDVVVSIAGEIRSDRERPGSTFAARLVEPLVVDGMEVARAGTLVGGRVTGAGVRAGPPPVPFLELCLSSVEIEGRAVPIRTGLYRLVAPVPERGAPSLAAVVIGSAAGALLGAAAGGRSGAATGALAGGAIGAAASSSPSSSQEYRFGDRLTFRLAEPLAVSTVGQPRSHP